MNQLITLLSIINKLKTFLASLDVEELRELYKLSKSGAIEQYIIEYGKQKMEAKEADGSAD